MAGRWIYTMESKRNVWSTVLVETSVCQTNFRESRSFATSCAFPGRGGAVVVPVLSLLLPIAMYGAAVSAGMDSNKAGVYIISIATAGRHLTETNVELQSMSLNHKVCPSHFMCASC